MSDFKELIGFATAEAAQDRFLLGDPPSSDRDKHLAAAMDKVFGDT
jgi:hypothetical protein